eukprot:3615739-Amphidinium_carterae.1
MVVAKAWTVSSLQRFMKMEKRKEEKTKKNEELEDFEATTKAVRKANYQWLQGLDSLMITGLGWGLKELIPARRPVPLARGNKRYVAEVPLGDGRSSKRVCIETSVGQRYIEVPRKSLEGEALPGKVLHLSLDQGPVGFSAMQYMRSRLGLRLTASWDLFHRLQNDWLSAVGASSLHVIRLEYLAVHRLRDGAFHSNSNHGALVAAAEELFALTDERNEIYELLYDRIVSEDEVLSQDIDVGSEHHYRKVFEVMKSRMVNHGLGEKCDTNRWWSFETIGRSVGAERSMLIFVMLWLAMRRGWYKKCSDPLLGFFGQSADEQPQVPLPGEEEECHGEEGLEEEGEEGGESKSKARAVVAEKRQKTVQSLKFSLDCLMDTRRSRLWQGMCHLPRELQCFHESAITAAKTLESMSQLHLNLADQQLLQVSLGIVRTFASAEFAVHTGMLSKLSQKSQFKKDEDMKVAQVLFKAAVHCAGAVSMTSLYYKTPPFCFLGLLSADASEVELCLLELKNVWCALEKVETEMLDDLFYRKWWQNCVYAGDTWARELFLMLYEENFESLNERVPVPVSQQLRQFVSTSLSSLVIEDGFNEVRRSTSKVRSQRCSPSSCWWAFSKMGLLEKYGRKNVETSVEGRASSQVIQSVHEPGKQECSLSPELLHDLTARKPTESWPTHSPEHLKECSLAWRLLGACKGDLAIPRKVWRSLLLQPGWVMISHGEKTCTVVVAVTQYGYMSMRMGVHKETRQLILPADGKKAMQFGYVCDLEDVRVASVRLVPPEHEENRGNNINLYIGTDATSLLKAAAKRGFKGMSLTYLRALASELQVVMLGRLETCTVKECVEALMTVVLGKSFNESALSKAMEHRAAPNEDEDLLLDTKMFQPDKDCVIDWDALDDSDLQDDYEQIKKSFESVVAKKCVQSKLKHGASSSAGASASSSSLGGRPPPPKRTFVSVRATGYSKQEAEAWLPPNCTLWKDLRENRWRVQSPFLPNCVTKSKSWGNRSQVTDYQAM